MTDLSAASYDPADHYWVIAGDESRAWSSARSAYVPADDAELARHRTRSVVTRIGSEAELWNVLAEQAPERLPNLAAAQETLKERRLAAIDVAQFRIHMNHENRLRALEGRPALTAAQFRAAIAALL
jgi:hypothetical protein